MTQRIRKLMYIDKGERLDYFTRWEEGALYSHPLSSLSTRHINMGNEEAHKLRPILNARIHSGDIMVTLDRWSVYSFSR